MNQLSLCVLLGVIALTGCSSKPVASGESEAESAALFNKGKGILFSDETKKLFGVEVSEVTEKPMRRSVQAIAQVYRIGDGGSPARAALLLSTDETKDLKVGQSVKLQPAQGDRAEITGRLVRLDAHAQTAFGQVEALVEFSDPQERCAAGAFLAATFTNGESRSALVIAQSALLTAADGCYVYTVNGSHLTRTRVKAGTASDGFVEIEDGLYAGDSVAAQGVENLWLVELSALKGGTPCCPVPKKNVEK